MDERVYEELEKNGVDVAGTLERFCGDKGIYETFLVRFFEEDEPAAMRAAFEGKDDELSLRESHTIKGVCLNLGLNEIAEICNEMVKSFRAGEPSRAYDMLPAFEEAYAKYKGMIG